jgi:splicing factor U2AF subunit
VLQLLLSDIQEDVMEECQKFGPVKSIKIPRPSREHQVLGVGKIFVHFENTEDSAKAMKSLAGRKFAERTVIASYITVESYENDEF